MLDFFTILSKGGFVLWCYTLQGVKTNFTEPINALIKDVILQERSGTANFVHGAVQMKYKLDNEYELIFVVGYQTILTLSYVDKLIDDVQQRFRDKYRQKLLDGTLCLLKTPFNCASEFAQLLKLAEQSQVKAPVMKTYEKSAKSQKTINSLKIEKNKKETPVNKKSKNSPKPGQNSSSGKSPDASPKPRKVEEPSDVARQRELFIQKQLQARSNKTDKKKKGLSDKSKKERVWDNGGTAKDAPVLDYSSPKPQTNGHEPDMELVTETEQSWVNRSSSIQALEVEEVETYDAVEVQKTSAAESDKKSSAGLFGMFRSLVGSKALTKEALQPVLDTMSDHLIGKNVAADIASKMCESVATKLEGKVLGTFSTIAYAVKQSLNESLVQILTPKRRVDILRDVLEAQRSARPYVVTFCGVNGVGKSTNLAKICFWLMENGFRVMIAACDTFRAGAVEQLRTHVARLNALHPPSKNNGISQVHLYEKGYGKDAAGIAMQAIYAARDQRYDVVLVDTAGRMQDNEPLMRALAKLISVNSPDLVLFVGEALVGNEAVDQLVKFNQALADHSNSQEPRIIDGIVLTKFDTIDDKVGAAISMTYITGQPIVFVGIGQSYPDLRSLNPKAVVQALLK
uniref:Signal recognition particle receptor subunit alpha-like n=1 Tax=Phallusia mammillata TaxID=59560 RepID=A0A6F9DT05_9ASCI|nr:signal recognition particle receptor subunit alpha-like [Phallusia mammillata]